MPDARRGDIWLGDLNPSRGHEQAGKRPLLIVSDDRFNTSAAGLVIVVPLTSQEKGIPYHVELNPPEGGIRTRSFLKTEDVRSISSERLISYWGSVDEPTMLEVERHLRNLMRL